MTDPIASMLTSIRNASLAKHKETVLSFSKMKFEIAKILAQEGFIESVTNEKKSDLFLQGHLVIRLKYTEDGAPVIKHIERVSKPGQRIYVSSGDIPRVLHGLGTVIISTSKGVISDKHARKQRVGGEILCTIW